MTKAESIFNTPVSLNLLTERESVTIVPLTLMLFEVMFFMSSESSEYVHAGVELAPFEETTCPLVPGSLLSFNGAPVPVRFTRFASIVPAVSALSEEPLPTVNC